MSSKSISKIGVTINSDLKPIPSISYTAPACSTSVPHGYREDMCGVGTYSGFVIDSVCNCFSTSQHVFTVNNTTVDSWSIEYLGGNMKPNIVSSTATTLTIDLSIVPSSLTTPVYCASGITDSVFEITASHEFAEKTFKVVAIQC